MQARAIPGSDRVFRQQAERIQRDIRSCVRAPARHPAIQAFQDIFREKDARLFHWARDRRIPADNNLSERDRRPLVIARKVSFGSQSLRGAHTRETLMSVIYSLKKQNRDVVACLKQALDQIALNPKLDLFRLLFPAKAPCPSPPRPLLLHHLARPPLCH